ncbi:protein phosphatase [Streptomyces sp. TLI_171]|uniref:protein-tyrosine phosphatase family protein n=1 Tax=Streptomyces sp. TLI_171 TaxID=1938859 RepID=UPI000C19F51E|nr:protein phosphatase [Streptomyces sp. TLI_171]RKE17140.1 hypothetical protein BX266_0391 [Streptomyces sp. TLI_171]
MTGPNDSGAPDPRAPWDEIAPGLWLGGLHWSDAAGRPSPVVVGAEFDLVVSLCRAAGHGPDREVPHRVLVLPDGPLDAWQLAAVQAMALATAEAMAFGRRVLVRCARGDDRSGLVAAQALLVLGLTVDEAVGLVRANRSLRALRNELFLDYLATGLDTARLLTSLSSPTS